MKRYLLVPDSFKGTMSAAEVCDIMERAVLRHQPGASVRKIPMADGGEGMVDAYLAICGGWRVPAQVSGPLPGQIVRAEYALLPDGTAVIEMAAAAGLPLAWGDRDVHQRDPMVTTTRGVGELLLHAAQNGAKNVILGLGGSATNDGGMGMAAALGYRFLDDQGRELPPVGGSLQAIADIERPARLPALTIQAACDVDNPLCGPRGAAAVFGPQKGATPQQVAQLDAGLQNLAARMKTALGANVQELPGGGAAGGLGAGVAAFLQGALRPGIDTLLDAVHFDTLLKDADMVFTGEGRIDGQSAAGKVPVGVARRCRAKGVPCVALCGCIGPGVEAVYTQGVTAVFASLRDSAPDFATVKQNSHGDMAYLADSVMRLLTATG